MLRQEIIHKINGETVYYYDSGEVVVEPTTELMVVNSTTLNVRSSPTRGNNIVDSLTKGTVVEVGTSVEADFHVWRELVNGNWVAEREIDGNPIYLVKQGTPPPPVGTKPQPLTGKFRLIDKYGGTYLSNAIGIGANQRLLNYFPTGIAPYYNDNDQMVWLDRVKELGFTMVRFYFSHVGATFEQQLVLASNLIARAKSRGLNVLLVVTDSIGSGFNIKDDEPWHNKSSLNHLNIEWYVERYKTHYMPRLNEIVKMVGDRDNVIIELLNEPAIVIDDLSVANQDKMINMFHDASKLIYEGSNGRIPVSLGVINTDHMRVASKDRLQDAISVYSRLPYVHIVSIHLYMEENMDANGELMFEKQGLIDVQAAIATKRAVFIGEIGVHVSFGTNRSEIISNALTRLLIGYPITNAIQWDFDIFQWDKGGSDGKGIAPYQVDGDEYITQLANYAAVMKSFN